MVFDETLTIRERVNRIWREGDNRSRTETVLGGGRDGRAALAVWRLGMQLQRYEEAISICRGDFRSPKITIK